MARSQTVIADFQDLNPVIHERTRLAIMTFLVSGESISFTELKQELGFKKEDDGTFWMCFDDFCDQFTSVDICKKSMPTHKNTHHEAAKSKL